MSNDPLVIYLDWNIVSDFISGKNSNTLTSLQEEIDLGNVVVPYSHGHLLEIANTTDESEKPREELVEEALDFLSSLSCNLYLEVEDQEAKVTKQSVQVTYSAVSFIKPFLEIPFPEGNTTDLSEIKERRLKYGLDPSRLNNLDPDEVVEHINQYFTSEENREKFPNDRVIGKTIEELYRESTSLANTIISAAGGVPSIGENLVIVYTFLNAFGYWPDKEEANSRRAQFIDARHQSAAVFSDIYVSNDRRHRKKTRATYSFFGIEETSVMSAQELVHKFEDST